MGWINSQWNDIKGNVKYGLLVSVPFIVGVITRGLAWWQQTILAALCVLVVAWAVVQTLKADKLLQSKELEKQSTDTPTIEQPDISVKDSDPKVYIEFHDDRGSVSSGMAETSLDLVNRGGRNAKWPCVEDIYLKEYVIYFSTTTGNLIVPGNGVVVEPGIHDNSKQPGYVQNMIQAFMREWFTYDDPNKYELSIPLSLTYQDDDKNLFETRCELVLYPGQEAKVKTHGVLPGIKVVDTRNHQFRKVAIATVKSSLL
jgi:hypothetical protein